MAASSSSSSELLSTLSSDPLPVRTTGSFDFGDGDRESEAARSTKDHPEENEIFTEEFWKKHPGILEIAKIVEATNQELREKEKSGRASATSGKFGAFTTLPDDDDQEERDEGTDEI